jgi:hypothetical protein
MDSLTRIQMMMGGACVMLLSGCAGSSGPSAVDEDALPSPSGAAVANYTPPQKRGLSKLTTGQPIGATDPSLSFDNLEILTTGLTSQLAVLRVGSNVTDAHLLSVFAGVKNKTPHPLEIEMQTVYIDASGNPLSEGKGSWVPIHLKPHEETQYRSVAISEAAADFTVRIRHAPDRDQTASQ